MRIHRRHDLACARVGQLLIGEQMLSRLECDRRLGCRERTCAGPARWWRWLTVLLSVFVLASCSDGKETSTCRNTWGGGIECTYERESAVGEFWKEHQGKIILGGGGLLLLTAVAISDEMDKRKKPDSVSRATALPPARSAVGSGDRWTTADQVRVGDVLVSATSALFVTSIHGDPQHPTLLGFVLADGSRVVVERGQRARVR